MRRLSRLFGLALLLGTTAIAAADAREIGPLTLVESGFIGDLNGLQPQSRGSIHHFYMKPGVDLARYDSVVVDPVSAVALPKTSIARVRDGDLADLCQEFTATVSERVGRTRTIAETAGPSTLRIHVTLTDVIPNRADFGFKDVDGFNRSFGIGGAAVQVEFRDSVTGELLAAFVDGRHGEDFRFNTNLHSVWGDVDDIIGMWSSTIAKQLVAQGS